MRSNARITAVGLAWLALWGGLAHGQPTDPDADTPPQDDPSAQRSDEDPSDEAAKEPAEDPRTTEEPPGPRLPVPQVITQADYPPAALEEGRGARVVLELFIDAEGRVLDAAIATSGGEDFDTAALAASDTWLFEPAIDAKGKPAPATIQFAYVFDPTVEPVLSLEGRARRAGDRRPFSSAQVTLTGPEGVVVRTIADEDGRFSVNDLAEGSWEVEIDGPGYEPSSAPVQVRDGKVANVTLYAVNSKPWESEAVDDSIEVVGRLVAPEITERSLSSKELRYLPGSNGDVVKGIQNLPGVARPPLGIGQLIIRGTSPEDSAYYVDGIAIPLAFHFGGLATVVPSDAIEEVAFLPGNFGVRYGRVIGGTLDIRTTTSLPERSGGYASVDLFQAAVFHEQRIGERTAITFSGRRSYVDAILNPILNRMEGVNIRAPRYYDMQARIQHELPSGGKLDAFFLLSDDRFRAVGASDDGEDELAQIGLTQAFRRLRLRWTEPLGSGWRNETAFGIGPSFQTFEFGGSGDAAEREWSVDVRQEFYRPAGDDGTLGWRFGLDARTDRATFLYDVPGFASAGLEEDAGWRFRPALYAESTARIGRFELIPGLRADGHFIGDHQTVWIDPRFAGRARLSDATTLKLAVGRYGQPPLVRQVLEGGGGTATLGPTSSLQTGIGVEAQLTEGVSIEINRFYNWLSNVIVGREDAFRFFTGPPPVGPFDVDPWANEGRGRVAGIEGMIRASTPRLLALGSVTVSRSVRIDRKGDENLFAFDQPVVLNALGSYTLPKGWRVGGRVRLGSGNPYTPVSNRIYDHQTRSFIPVYGDRDSARLPTFWSLDLRIDKEWTFDKWALSVYLDLQNATNNQNVEVISWTYDFRREDPIVGLPILPAFGIRGDW
ncbi:MAG: TonB family protein [Deltaproteobacteria bacterium]|nr:MAG: TonB family protein [Deltaproteobacteria bacterium]